MDKSWIKLPRNTLEYLIGLQGFLDFVFQHSSSAGTILCPCNKCGFKPKTRKEVWNHLTCKLFPEGYTFWCFHGETESGEFVASPPVIQDNLVNEDHMSNIVNEVPMQIMINDAFEFSRMHANEEPFPSSTEHRDGGGGGRSNSHHGATAGVKDFYDLLRDGEQLLYDGCTKYSKLYFLVKLYHIKCLCQVSDKAMSMIIELLHNAFQHAKISSSSYEARKLINKLGLDYTKIHTCPNDCILYWGEDEDRDECKICQISRWKERGKDNASVRGSIVLKPRKKLPAKILQYFPLIPRLKRMFMSSQTTKSMVWHVEENNNDGMMRHSRDSQAWKNFDLTYPDFASDRRNVRLALASDGFNPFGSMSVNYSIWPLILIPYNTPPWTCVKPTNFIPSSLIPEKRMTGNDIDVYM